MYTRREKEKKWRGEKEGETEERYKEEKKMERKKGTIGKEKQRAEREGRRC